MPKKFKFNSVCKKNIHTNNAFLFARHVFSCTECQKGLPPEVFGEIKSYMNKLKESKANKQKLEASKTKSDKEKSIKISQKVKPTKNVEKKVDEATPPSKSPASKSPDTLKVSASTPTTKFNPEILSEAIQKTPIFGVLASTIKTVSENNQKFSTKVNNDFGKLSTEVGALKDGFTGLGEAIKVLTQKMIEGQSSPNVFAGEEAMTEEHAKEAEPVGDEISASEVKKTPEPQGTAISGKKDLPELSPQEIGEMENYLAKEKARLGQEGDKPVGGGPTGALNPIIGGVKDTVREVRGVIDAFMGRGGEAPALPRTTEELATQVLLNTVKAAGNRKDPIDYFIKGKELGNADITNAIKLVTAFLGKGGGISGDDIKKIVREEIGGKGGSEESVE